MMLYLSSSSRTDGNLEAFLCECGESGIRHVELSGGADHTEGLLVMLKDMQNRYDLRYLVHNYFPPPKSHFILNIASSDPTLRRRSVDFAKRAIDLAHKIGSPLYTIHAGYMADLKLTDDGEHFTPTGSKRSNREAILDYFARSVRELAEHAAEANVRFGVENLFPTNTGNNFSIMCHPDEHLWFLDRFAADNAGMLLDLGHLNIAANLLDFDKAAYIEKLSKDWMDHVLEVHLSDNAGITDSHDFPPVDGWMLNCVMEAGLQSRPVCLEARGSSFDTVISHYNAINNKLYGEQ